MTTTSEWLDRVDDRQLWPFKLLLSDLVEVDLMVSVMPLAAQRAKFVRIAPLVFKMAHALNWEIDRDGILNYIRVTPMDVPWSIEEILVRPCMVRADDKFRLDPVTIEMSASWRAVVDRQVVA